MKRARLDAMMQWLNDGGSRWLFWSGFSIAFFCFEISVREWWWAGMFAALTLFWAFYVGPRAVRSNRRLRAAQKGLEDEQARFFWSMGTKGVPLATARQVQLLLADDKVWQAQVLLRDHISLN